MQVIKSLKRHLLDSELNKQVFTNLDLDLAWNQLPEPNAITKEK